jgi:hypothetical protein
MLKTKSVVVAALVLLPAVLLILCCHSSPTSTEDEGQSGSSSTVQTISAAISCTPEYNVLPTSIKTCVTIRNLVDSPRTVDGTIDLLLGSGEPLHSWRVQNVTIEPNGRWDRCWVNEAFDLQSLDGKNIARLLVVDVTPPPYNQPPHPPAGSTAEATCFFWGLQP